MAKTNSSTRRDVVTRVHRQHDTIRRLFDDVEKASPARRAEAFQPLVRMLAVHETAEEIVVYPALVLAGPDARAIVRARKAEEDQAKKDLADLEGIDAGSREFLTRLRAFRADVEAHASKDASGFTNNGATDTNHAAGHLARIAGAFREQLEAFRF